MKGSVGSFVIQSLRKDQSQKFLHSGAKVSRQQATKVIQHLKQSGLAGKVTSNATTYTSDAFRKEANRQDMIKRQNVSDRQKELAAEKATETKPTRTVTAGAGIQLAINRTAFMETTTHHDDSHPSRSGVTKTDLKPLNSLSSPLKQPDDLIDLAID